MVGIDEYAADFNASRGEIKLVGDLMIGTTAFRKASSAYLPLHEAETKLSHDMRVSTAVLKNLYMDALRNISSRPFGRDISIAGAEGLPIENVTRNGVSFQEFCRSVFMNAIAFGEQFVLCDFPKTGGVKTLEDMRKEKIQPYLTKVNPLNILDYVEEDGRCTVFRVATTRMNLVNGFGKEYVNQICVYTPGNILVFEQDKDQKWFQSDSIDTGLNFVPVTRIVIGEESEGRRPVSPMIDCAYAQVEHYQMSVAVRNSLEMTAYPMLAGQGIGISSEPIPTGPGVVLYTGQEGKWELLEPSGTSYTSLQERLNAIEREIMILGLQPLLPQAGNIAALVGEIQASKAHAAIRAWSITLKEKMEQMLNQMGAWLDIKTDAEVTIDTDFGMSESTMSEVSQLLVAFKEGAIDKNFLLSELTKRNFVTGATAPAAMPQPTGVSSKS